MYQAGLVLEGGGMSGVYTAGVLDFFIEQNIEFSSCYGVSAGACNMLSYISKQRKRAYHCMADYAGDSNAVGAYSLLLTGDIFNYELYYHRIPDELIPFDYDTFSAYQGKCFATVTNIKTGKPEYLRINDVKKDIDAIRASASLPLVSRNVLYNGNYYLDGGIADAIPLKRSILGGNQKNIVIMTKEEGYLRKQTKSLPLIKARYRAYPAVYRLMRDRHIMYNQTLAYLEKQTANGHAFILRPKTKSSVGRIERDPAKLLELYKAGYRDARKNHQKMVEYLES